MNKQTAITLGIVVFFILSVVVVNAQQSNNKTKMMDNSEEKIAATDAMIQPTIVTMKKNPAM